MEFGNNRKFGRRKHFEKILLFRIGVVIFITTIYSIIGTTTIDAKIEEKEINIGRHLLLKNPEEKNCTSPSVNDFPSDGFTRQQRKQGWIVIHVFLAAYLFILLALVCHDYFVPAIKGICNRFHVKEDIAGATFMAIASSSPELFINSVGTFITEGDIGVGTVVGSAVFNVLAVPAFCGLCANMVVQLEWWPITRDCTVYAVSVIMLITVLFDGIVRLNDSIMLICTYIIYLIIMYYNEPISNMMTRLTRKLRKSRGHYQEILLETQPLLSSCQKNNCYNKNGFLSLSGSGSSDITLKDCEDFEAGTNIWRWPSEYNILGKIWWIFTWPISFVLFLTMPNCQKYPKLMTGTFLMCICWIGGSSYIVAWLITTIGDVLSIPDSVMGLTFLAAGTSVPEAVSSIIVTNQGYGGMGLSSAIASNTFDILICLGIPWLVKTWFYPKHANEHLIYINSSGLVYSGISLLSTLIFFYICLVLNKFRLDWKVGLWCLILYVTFICVASLIELNVFFPVNLPTCN
ncbi:sodium/potassium/calcium exchanger 4-like [Onthophagus taurus]|uniref:sodium/potassium/calcium exchanger 4-like n=1 Tax=Onthophagus taurus TaxID=166361 RepID=UPI0039BE27C7